MRATERRLELDCEALDLDVSDDETWVAFVRTSETGRQLVFSDGSSVEPPRRFEFPIVRAAGRGRAVLAEARVDRDEVNGFVVDSSGRVETSFRFGDGIEDVLVSSEDVVVTYFDEGVFSGAGGAPAAEGVAVFGYDGRLTLGYNTSRFSGDVFVADCYCAAWAKGRRLFFCPYTGDEPSFPLIAIDLRTGNHEQWKTPRGVKGSVALTVGPSKGGRECVYFHAPYDDRSGIYRWYVGDDRAERVAQHPGRLRGLRGGRFLAAGVTGYTVLDFDEHDR
jgi:hypothetical protein